MKKASLLAGVAVLALWAGSAEAQTLQESLSSAYTTNPTLQAQRAALRATDEAVPQALSNWRPTVTLSQSYGRSHVDFENNPPARPDITLSPNTLQLSASQPLYRGGRTVAATKSAEAAVQAGRATLTNVEQQVLLNVVTAYMDVLRDAAVLELNRNNEQVLGKQQGAAQDRFRVGEITRTDVSQSDARLAGARANRQTAEGTLISSRATFQRVIGQIPANLQPPPSIAPRLPANEDAALAIALEENPALIAAMFNEESSRHDIRVASGALLPTLGLSGTLSRSSETGTTPDLQLDTAQVLATLSVPLYEAGSVYSQTRQRKQINSQRIVQVEETRRQVRQAVTQAWENLQTARANITARNAQIQAAQVALDGVQQEAQVGSRTTLDVLDAEQELLDASVALVRAQRDEFVASYNLLGAIGRLTARNLGLPVELYEPAENYSRVRDKWFGTDGGLE